MPGFAWLQTCVWSWFHCVEQLYVVGRAASARLQTQVAVLGTPYTCLPTRQACNHMERLLLAWVVAGSSALTY